MLIFRKTHQLSFFLHVISSPTRIIGTVFVGFLALVFGVFVYPGNERLQNIAYSKLEGPVVVVKNDESEKSPPVPLNVVAQKAAPPVAAPAVPTAKPAPSAQVSAVAPAVIVPVPAPLAAAGVLPSANSGQAAFTDLKRAIRAIAPKRTDEYVDKLASDYEALPHHSALVSKLTDPGFFRVGDIGRGTDRAQELTLERCQVYYGETCVLIALDGKVVLPLDKKKWTPMGTPRLAYSGKFRVDMVPGPRIDQIGILENFGKESTGARALVVDSRGGAHPGRDDVFEKTAEANAFSACKSANAGRDAVCVLYATNDRVVFGQRVTAPR